MRLVEQSLEESDSDHQILKNESTVMRGGFNTYRPGISLPIPVKNSAATCIFLIAPY